MGVGVHCGEGGAYNKTPHKVVLAWLRDVPLLADMLTTGGEAYRFVRGIGP